MSGLAFDKDTHTYTLDGVVVPSVTGILKSSGLINFDSVPEAILASALKRGQVCHQAIHYLNENDLDVGEFFGNFPQYAGYVRGWIAFKELRRFRPVLCERRVASRRHRVAGTLDVLGEIDDGVAALVDYKTAVSLRSVCPDLQLAAYHALALEWASDDPELAAFLKAHPRIRRFAIQLRKDGSFGVEEYSDPRLFSEFLALLQAYHIVQARRPKETPYSELAHHAA